MSKLYTLIAIEFMSQGNVNIDEAAQPIETYKTFNEFFYRKLKPGARPIAAASDCTVLVGPWPHQIFVS